MKLSPPFFALLFTTFAGRALAATYSLSQSIVGSEFYTAFNFEAIGDPTNGRVNYVDQATAQSLNLTYASDDAFILRADDTTVLSSSGPGRNSVRIRTNDAYTYHVAVFDMGHMPAGCGTWPAVWETNESNWPNGGEVDIVEGVNNVPPNSISLHTGAGCTMPTSRTQLGTTTGTDCNANDDGNAGCGVQCSDNNSYGIGFNNIGGGWYAMERTADFIKVWFWERGATNVPSDVKSTATSKRATWNYVGCAEDSVSARLLAEYYPNPSVTVESCQTLCGNDGYDYAGLEYASQCFCGNSYLVPLTLLPASDCDMACGGNAGEICGGPNALSLYSTSSSGGGTTPPPSGGTTVDTDNWGEPQAYFPNTDCDIDAEFDANNIIINLTFCGDWAGNSGVYSSSGCPSDCVDYVNQNPSAFTNAYFEFNSIRIFE